MATARTIAYIAKKLGKEDNVKPAMQLTSFVKDRIVRLYVRANYGSFLPRNRLGWQMSPGPEMSLYSRVVPGSFWCTVLRGYFKREGHTWPGSEENAFVKALSETDTRKMIETGELTKRGPNWSMGWSQVTLFILSLIRHITRESPNCQCTSIVAWFQ